MSEQEQYDTYPDVAEQWAGWLYDPARNHDKVWAACYTRSGKFVARWGRRGQKLSGSVKDFGDPKTAAGAFRAARESKIEKGYAECSFDEPLREGSISATIPTFLAAVEVKRKGTKVDWITVGMAETGALEGVRTPLGALVTDVSFEVPPEAKLPEGWQRAVTTTGDTRCAGCKEPISLGGRSGYRRIMAGGGTANSYAHDRCLEQGIYVESDSNNHSFMLAGVGMASDSLIYQTQIVQKVGEWLVLRMASEPVTERQEQAARLTRAGVTISAFYNTRRAVLKAAGNAPAPQTKTLAPQIETIQTPRRPAPEPGSNPQYANNPYYAVSVHLAELFGRERQLTGDVLDEWLGHVYASGYHCYFAVGRTSSNMVGIYALRMRDDGDQRQDEYVNSDTAVSVLPASSEELALQTFNATIGNARIEGGRGRPLPFGRVKFEHANYHRLPGFVWIIARLGELQNFQIRRARNVEIGSIELVQVRRGLRR